MGSDIGAPRAKLEARYLGQGRTTMAKLEYSPPHTLDHDYGDELDHGLATLSEEPAEY